MKRSIGFRAHLSFRTLGKGGGDAGLKLHQSDLASALAFSVSRAAAGGTSAALAAHAQATEVIRIRAHRNTAATEP